MLSSFHASQDSANSPADTTTFSRRALLAKAGGGAGLLALAALLQDEKLLGAPGNESSAHGLAARKSHFPAKAKSVIWLFMNGGPSHVDTWDYKPELARRDGKELKGFDQEHRLLHRIRSAR